MIFFPMSFLQSGAECCPRRCLWSVYWYGSGQSVARKNVTPAYEHQTHLCVSVGRSSPDHWGVVRTRQSRNKEDKAAVGSEGRRRSLHFVRPTAPRVPES